MDYLSVMPPEIFLKICSNLSISSLVQLSVVYPQWIDNRFWHALYIGKFEYKFIYYDDINWKRKYISEFFKCFMRTLFSEFGNDFRHTSVPYCCLKESRYYDQTVWKIKDLIIADLDDNDENFSSVMLYLKNNQYIRSNWRFKSKWSIMAWFEAEEEIAPFFNNELLAEIKYYASTEIHFGLVTSMARKRCWDIEEMLDLLMLKQLPIELHYIEPAYRKCLKRFLKHHNLRLNKYHLGVALMLRMEIIS